MSPETFTCYNRSNEQKHVFNNPCPHHWQWLLNTKNRCDKPLQAPPFIYNPNLEQCAAWMLLIYKISE